MLIAQTTSYASTVRESVDRMETAALTTAVLTMVLPLLMTAARTLMAEEMPMSTPTVVRLPR
jgi:hypothetical protein